MFQFYLAAGSRRRVPRLRAMDYRRPASYCRSAFPRLCQCPTNTPPERTNSPVHLDVFLVQMLAPPLRRDIPDLLSRIFRSACCTPSPKTSRVMLTLSVLRRLVDLIDVDDADFSPLHIVIGVLQRTENDDFHVLADIASLGQRRGVGNAERDDRTLASVLASSVCPSRSVRSKGYASISTSAKGSG